MPDIIKGLKHARQMEENDADKISPKLFELMLESAMEKGNRLIWAMSVLQWSLMACSRTLITWCSSRLPWEVTQSV